MRRGTLSRAWAAVALAAVFSALTVAAGAQDRMGGRMDKMGGADKQKVTVALVRSDWCSACQKLEPVMAELMKEYAGRINFVVLDVTDDERAARAAATARKHGLAKFFEANKKKTSTVAVFGAGKKMLYRTDHNAERGDYVRAFDAAINGAG